MPASQCRGNNRVLTLGYPREIFYCEWWAKEQSFDLQFAPGGWGLQQGTESQKVIIPALPRRWGAVVTNDWCISCTFSFPFFNLIKHIVLS